MREKRAWLRESRAMVAIATAAARGQLRECGQARGGARLALRLPAGAKARQDGLPVPIRSGSVQRRENIE